MDILVKTLRKKYGDTSVLNLQNLYFRSGAITGVLGQNGSGKSTLLRILAGLDNDFEGDISYGGSCYTNKLAKCMTMVFQKPMLLRGSVYKNIEYPLVLRGLAGHERAQRVDEMIELFALGHLARKSALSLSGGESQKVALARALVFRPEILLLDEPLSAIDYDTTEKMEDMITSYKNTANATIIMVTHSIIGASRICDNTVFLNRERGGSVNGVFKSDERTESTGHY